ncbi:MIP/aquaporin family protein [Bifidobacterium avesanii]|nr:MIP/aquaporin family protein [Bifidobacterium avesanii]
MENTIMSLWTVFGSEFIGTCLMIAVAVMVCGSRALPKTGAYGGDWINASLGWGLAVYVGVYVGWRSGAHLNPIITLARVLRHQFDPSVTMNGVALADGGVPVTAAAVCVYIAAQFVGAFAGACLGWAAIRKHFDEPAPTDAKLTIFCTKPPIKSPVWNVVSEIIATFIQVIWVFVNGGTPTAVGPLGIALVITVLVMGLGGVSGAAMNPARDFAPRLAHFVLPIKGKGDSDWGYAWVPFVGPLIGGALGVLVPTALGLIA